MQKVEQNKRICLSGGGDENQSFPLDKFFFNTLPKNGYFLYIPVALRGHKLYPTTHLWMKKVIELHNRTDLQLEVASDLGKYKLEDLKNFDAIYIGGGNTWNLIQEFKDSGFSDLLIKYIESGRRVYGGSAGAIILGKKIDNQDDQNETGLRETSGLDLLYDHSIVCHFKEDQGDQVKKWVIDNNLPIICLPEETGLAIKNDTALCIGAKPCTIYFTDGTKKDIKTGDSFLLKGKVPA